MRHKDQNRTMGGIKRLCGIWSRELHNRPIAGSFLPSEGQVLMGNLPPLLTDKFCLCYKQLREVCQRIIDSNRGQPIMALAAKKPLIEVNMWLQVPHVLTLMDVTHSAKSYCWVPLQKAVFRWWNVLFTDPKSTLEACRTSRFQATFGKAGDSADTGSQRRSHQ